MARAIAAARDTDLVLGSVRGVTDSRHRSRGRPRFFGGGRGQTDSGRAAVAKWPGHAAGVVQQVPCDRCHVALAKVGVITAEGRGCVVMIGSSH